MLLAVIFKKKHDDGANGNVDYVTVEKCLFLLFF